jgi:hypothetical protein
MIVSSIPTARDLIMQMSCAHFGVRVVALLELFHHILAADEIFLPRLINIRMRLGGL